MMRHNIGHSKCTMYMQNEVHSMDPKILMEISVEKQSVGYGVELHIRLNK